MIDWKPGVSQHWFLVSVHWRWDVMTAMCMLTVLWQFPQWVDILPWCHILQCWKSNTGFLVFFSPYFHIQQTYNNVLQPHRALRVVHRAFHRQHQLKPLFCYRSIANRNSFLQGCRARHVAFLYNPDVFYTREDNRATSSLFLSSIKLQRHMKKKQTSQWTNEFQMTALRSNSIEDRFCILT